MKYALGLSLILWGLIYTVVDAWGLPASMPVPMYIVEVNSEQASRPLLRRVVVDAINYWRAEGLRLNRRKTERRADPFYKLRTVGANFLSFNEEFISWWLTLSEEGKLWRNVATHVIAPGFTIAGNLYMGGFAFRDSLKWGAMSYSNCYEFNTAGEARPRFCVVAMAHELGHSVIGCEHETGANIMNADALFVQAKEDKEIKSGRLLPVGPLCKARLVRFIKGRR